MMLKHTGRLKANQRKVVVAYKVVPGEPENCVVITTENLNADQHDTLMRTLESSSGQEAFEFATVMQRTYLPDGRNMLAAFHTQGKMVKMPTNQIEMTPDRNSVILLSELNDIIAQQRGVTVGDLAISDGSGTKKAASKEVIADPVTPVASTDNAVLSDDEIAAKYRSDADRLFKEAKRLREQADEISPTKKKTKKTEESA
jgi:hypothetical protein